MTRPDDASEKPRGLGGGRGPLAVLLSGGGRIPALLLLIVTTAVYSRFEARRAAQVTFLSPDEATTIIAARAIVASGLPLTPSHQIYYRSPLSHYLDALSITVLGDHMLGWRGASVLAYALLMLLPGLLLLLGGQPWLAAPWAALVGLIQPLLLAGYSARMYMVYTLCATLSVLLAALWAPVRYDRRGVAYLGATVAAALAHQHFVVVIPGLVLLAALTWWETPGLSFRRLWRTPLLTGPFLALAIAMLFHFGDNGNLLPNAFANTSSQVVSMANEWSFRYPLEVLGAYLPVPPLLLLGVLLVWSAFSRRSFRPSKATTRATAVVLVSYVLISITLPFQIEQYVAPLFPLVCFALFTIPLDGGEAPRRPQRLAWSCGAGLVALVMAMAHFHNGSTGTPGDLGWAWRNMRSRPSPNPANAWRAIQAFAAATHATLISSAPEIVMLHVGPVAAHVRSWNVAAISPCSVVMDDFQPIPVAHHPCQLEEIATSAGRRSVPIVFIGDRLGWTIGPDSTAFIRVRFARIGVVDKQEVWCLGGACEVLKRAFDAASG